MLLDREPRRLARKIIPTAVLALAIPLSSACVSQQGNETPTPSPTPFCLMEVGVPPSTKRSLGQFLIINGLPDGPVEIFDGKTVKQYNLPQDKAGKRVMLPHDLNAEVVFEEKSHILFRKDCNNDNLPSKSL